MKHIYLTIILSFCTYVVLAQSLKKEYINPASGYTQVVAVTHGNVKTLYISGQIGKGDNLEEQLRSTFKNLEKQLTDSGASFKDVVKMNTYIVNYKPKQLATFRNIRKELYGDNNMPASTLVGVTSLALKEWLVEMDAVAIFEIE